MNENSQFLFTWEGDGGKQIKTYRINHYMLDMEFFFEGVPTWYSYGYCLDQNPKCTKDFYAKQLSNRLYKEDINNDEYFSLLFFGWDFAFSNAGKSFKNINSMMDGFQNNSLKELNL